MEGNIGMMDLMRAMEATERRSRAGRAQRPDALACAIEQKMPRCP